jgi:hypothetical protein
VHRDIILSRRAFVNEAKSSVPFASPGDKELVTAARSFGHREATIQINATTIQINATTIQINATTIQINATTIQINATTIQINATTG